MALTAKEHLEAGQLQNAILAMNDEVKKKPTDMQLRSFLAELLCAAGQFDRADLQLEIVLQQDPKAALGVALVRQLIRAETARRDFHLAGRPPELLDSPPPHVQLSLQASISLREKEAAGAMQLLDQAEAQRPKVKGTCNRQRFEELRDLDDLTAGVFEVLTSTGKFYWIPVERVQSIEFRKPERLRDLVWRRALMSVTAGPDGEVFLPATYVPQGNGVEDRFLLGRVTEWRGGAGTPSRGVGQVCFLVGEESVPIMKLESIEFETIA